MQQSENSPKGIFELCSYLTFGGEDRICIWLCANFPLVDSSLILCIFLSLFTDLEGCHLVAFVKEVLAEGVESENMAASIEGVDHQDVQTACSWKQG